MRKTGWRKFELVEVWWNDHSCDSGWVTEPDDFEQPPVQVRTIGWKVREDESRIWLVTSLTSEKDLGGLNEILKATVVKTKTLRKMY